MGIDTEPGAMLILPFFFYIVDEQVEQNTFIELSYLSQES